MSLKYVATEDWEWEFNSGKGTVTVTEGISEKVKCDGKKALIGTIKFTISNYSGQGISQGSGEGTIKGSATKLKIEGKGAVLEGDESDNIAVTGLNQAPPPPKLTVYVTVKVKKAGQTKVKAE